jgi:hypothetical protein
LKAKKLILGKFSLIDWDKSDKSELFLAHVTILKPSEANLKTKLRPIPLVPPVIIKFGIIFQK